MRNLLLAVLLPSLALGLVACGSTGQRQSASTSDDLSGGLLRTETSGDEWLAEATLATGSRAAELYLNAAQAYLAERRFDALGAVLTRIELPPARPALRERYARLRAAWHLSAGDAALARQWLSSTAAPRRSVRSRRSDPAGAGDAEIDDYWLLVAAISEAAGDWAATASALARVEDAGRYRRSPWFSDRATAALYAAVAPEDRSIEALGSSEDNLLETPQQRAQVGSTEDPQLDRSADLEAAATDQQLLHDHLWLALNRTRRSAALTQAATALPRERGWWALRLEVAAATTLGQRRTVLQRWQRQHGGHPGAYPWPNALRRLAQPVNDSTPLQVALLLPLSGPLSAAGNAIRDGFIATQLEAALPLVARFYDVNAAPLPQLLESISTSADVIVGPVTKERVSELAALAPAQPSLVLNYLDSSAPQQEPALDQAPGANTPQTMTTPQPPAAVTNPLPDPTTTEIPFQLGIAIEDEAQTLIDQLQRSGVERLLVVHGTAGWAQRAAQTIAAGWTGYLRTERFESVKTVTEAIGTGMLVDDSHRRAQQLRRTIGTHIEFVPRARQDLDAIVALVSPVEAEALRPALRFHFAGQLPVFSTSQLLRSRVLEDQPGLSGIQLTELPGLLATDEQAQRFNAAFGLPASRLAGLYTLGADAARLVEHLPLMMRDPVFALDGATGALTLADDGRRLQRELGWAVLSQGRARPAPVVQAEAAEPGREDQRSSGSGIPGL